MEESEIFSQEFSQYSQNQMTQLYDEDELDDDDEEEEQSQTSQESTGDNKKEIDLRTIPWGRLVPCCHSGDAFVNGNNNENGASEQESSNNSQISSQPISSMMTARMGNNRNDSPNPTPSTLSSTPGSTPSTPTAATGSTSINIELLPREADEPTNSLSTNQTPQDPSVSFLGLSLSPSDRFNEYVLGRSHKCDVVVQAPPSLSNPTTTTTTTHNGSGASSSTNTTNTSESSNNKKYEKIIHGMISNKHCRVFCMLKHPIVSSCATTSTNTSESGLNRKDTDGSSSTCNSSASYSSHDGTTPAVSTSTSKATTTNNNNNNNNTPNQPSQNNHLQEMEVFIEDTSGNGTLINHTTLLQRGERRILHTGDTISLINPAILRKKLKNQHALKQTEVLNHYSFVFINVYATQRGGFVSQACTANESSIPTTTSSTTTADGGDGNGFPYEEMMDVIPPSYQRTGLVNIRQTNLHSIDRNNNNKDRNNDDMPPPPEKKQRTSARLHISLQDQQQQQQQQMKDGVYSNVSSISASLYPPPTTTSTTNNMNTSRKQKRSSQSNINTIKNNNSPTTTRRIEQYYDLRDEIGAGTCGQVRRAIHRQSGQMVAVKIISVGRGSGPGACSSSDMRNKLMDPKLHAEAKILQSLNHAYIVKLLDVFVQMGNGGGSGVMGGDGSGGSGGGCIFFVLELCQGGDLFDRIMSKGGRYTEGESRRVMRRLLSAVHFLHEQRDIVHRDLKPENILCPSKTDDITVKLTDFGLAKSITEDGLKTFCGTPLYFAPEVLERRHTIAGQGRYGKEADMWSLGIILYILLSGLPPFDVSDNMDVVVDAEISFDDPVFNTISDGAKDLVIKLLQKDSIQRLNVVDACDHEWINVVDGDTHTHPLDDPALTEQQRRVLPPPAKVAATPQRPMKRKHAQINHQSPPSRSLSSPAAVGAAASPLPQSIIQSPSPRKNIALSPNDTDEKSFNQSAHLNFPTPTHKKPSSQLQSQEYGNGESNQRRDSLFSFVRQLSVDKCVENMEGESEPESSNIHDSDKKEQSSITSFLIDPAEKREPAKK